MQIESRRGAWPMRYVGVEASVRQSDCGQLQLAVDDEVAFCCVSGEDGGGHAARLVELLRTSRSGASLLGCFVLELPRTRAPEEGEADAHVEAEPLKPRILWPRPTPTAHIFGRVLAHRCCISIPYAIQTSDFIMDA